jgi:hypothetical protein
VLIEDVSDIKINLEKEENKQPGKGPSRSPHVSRLYESGELASVQTLSMAHDLRLRWPGKSAFSTTNAY